MITFDYNGEIYKFTGEYARPQDQDFLTDTGQVLHSFGMWPLNELRAIVRPVRQEYTFGGVRFRETGDRRPAKRDEWVLFEGRPLYLGEDGESGSWLILEPC